MFTGIVEEVGTLVVRDDQADSARLQVRGTRTLEGVALGDSIAVNGVGLLVAGGGALSPVLAAILHNASSVAVAVNSARLVRHRR
ncbi:hypothetical protein [Curtobacterium sp. P97]|uniref:hypothetical protein n=1 Tax=Curtobacterium sp. P97 TaxID=2939562 RepID=UPI002559DD0D|nr:hypothetical protein [Curtobacterium sp. P97]